MKILIVCTSNADRSPAIEKYLRDKYPQHEYKSCGINKYHTSNKGTTYISNELLDWADMLVCMEEIHFKKINEFLEICTYGYGLIEYPQHLYDFVQKNRQYIILSLGKYEKGNVNEDYLKRAEEKLKPFLS